MICPQCNKARKRYKKRSWFTRHLETAHGYTRLQALDTYLTACGQMDFLDIPDLSTVPTIEELRHEFSQFSI